MLLRCSLKSCCNVVKHYEVIARCYKALKKLCDDCAIKALTHSYSLKKVVDIVYRLEICGAYRLSRIRAEHHCVIACIYTSEERVAVFYEYNVTFLKVRKLNLFAHIFLRGKSSRTLKTGICQRIISFDLST